MSKPNSEPEVPEVPEEDAKTEPEKTKTKPKNKTDDILNRFKKKDSAATLFASGDNNPYTPEPQVKETDEEETPANEKPKSEPAPVEEAEETAKTEEPQKEENPTPKKTPKKKTTKTPKTKNETPDVTLSSFEQDFNDTRTVEEKSTRQTYLIDNDVLKDFNAIAKGKKKGYKTYIVNKLLAQFVEENK